MLNTQKLLYLLPDLAYIAELVPDKKPNSFSIQAFKQVNGEFFKSNKLIPEHVAKLFNKLEVGETYTVVLPDFLFTNTIVSVDETTDSKIKTKLQEEVLDGLKLTPDSHLIETTSLNELKGTTRVQISAIDKSLLEVLQVAVEEKGVTVDAVVPLSWSIKSLISLEPSISVLQLGSHLYGAQHYIGVDQTSDSKVTDTQKIAETVKTLKGAEPSIQTLYLLSESKVEKELKSELKDIVPMQQMAEKGGDDKLPSHIKVIIESALKTLSIEDFPAPKFDLGKPEQKVSDKYAAIFAGESMSEETDSGEEGQNLPKPSSPDTDEERSEGAGVGAGVAVGVAAGTAAAATTAAAASVAAAKETGSDNDMPKTSSNKSDEKDTQTTEEVKEETTSKETEEIEEITPEESEDSEEEKSTEQSDAETGDEAEATETKTDETEETKEEAEKATAVTEEGEEAEATDETAKEEAADDDKEESEPENKAGDQEKEAEEEKKDAGQETSSEDNKNEQDQVESDADSIELGDAAVVVGAGQIGSAVVKPDQESSIDTGGDEEIDLSQFTQKGADSSSDSAGTQLTDEKKSEKETIKNNSGVSHMLKMILITTGVFILTVVIGIGVGMAILRFTNQGQETTPEVEVEETQQPEPTPEPTPDPEATASAELNKDELEILVVNATTKAGYAGEVGDDLEADGFENVTAANAKGEYEEEGIFVYLAEENQDLIDALEEASGLSLTISEDDNLEDPQGNYDAVIVLAE